MENYKTKTIANRRGGEHVHVAEAVLGKSLPRGAEVHHVDGDPANNVKSNLVICQDRAYHKLLHARTQAVRAGRNPNASDSPKLRNVTVSEEVWAKLKQRALDERVTLREVVERAARQYLVLADVRAMPVGPRPGLSPIGGAPVAKHWMKDDDPA